MADLYAVYKHIVPNGKVYIGITKDLPEIHWHHGAGYKENQAFWKDILAYGWNNIKHEILFTDLSKEEAKKKENELILKHKSNDKNFGYNSKLNGDNPIRKEKLTKTNSDLLKARMVEYGDTDCVNKLTQLLDCSRTTASNKLNGYTLFYQSEIAIIADYYNLTAEDIKKIFIGGD